MKKPKKLKLDQPLIKTNFEILEKIVNYNILKAVKLKSKIMKTQKKFRLLLITAMMIFATISMAQISKQQAIDFVMDSIVGNQSDSINVYMETNVQTNTYYSTSLYDSIQSPYSEYWLFFIDQYPFALEWGHPCKYVFTDKQSGNIYIHYDQLPPFNYKLNLEPVSISYEYITPSIDTLKTQLQSSYIDNGNLYAVVFAVGNYWHGISHLFSTLKEKGFKQDNIYVLFEDGNPNNSHILDMDLNNDGIDDILENTICNYNSLDSIFNILKTKMTNEDILFLYSMSHGEQTDTTNGLRLKLWNNSPILDSELAAMIEPIKYSELIYFVLSCHSGGMIDNFSKPHQTIITCVDFDSYYFGNPFVESNTGMSPFEYGTITSLRGFHPAGKDEPWNQGEQIGDYENISSIIPYITSDDINPDSIINNGNNDYVIQLQEVINYTSFIDTEFNTSGQFSYNLGFKEDLLSLTGISGEVDTTQTLQGNYLIGGELSINSGVNLTLDTSTNFFVSGTKIIVKQGAVLTLDGATVTSVHDSAWQGVEVWGNTNAHQYTINDSCAQGKLYLKNNAAIKNAYNAVTLWKPDSWNNRGGIIIAKDSKFIDNKRSVEFMAYQNHHPVSGEETNYVSSFTNCDFIYDDNYLLSEGMKNHVTMWGVRGIEFRGCSFINEVSSEPNTGYGIFSLDAGYRIKDYCNAQIMPCPESGIIRSTFKGLKFGIQSANVNKPLYNISIFNSDFTNNGYGVHLASTYGSAIVNNNFKLGAIYDTCNNLFGTGMYLDNSKAFAIENNSFTLYDNSIEAEYLGIHTINTNNAFDEIYKNDFDDMIEANRAEGKNWWIHKEQGLAYYCNTNQNNSWDFVVERKGDINNIQLFQGSKSYPAGNTFSTGATKHFYNNGDDEVTYYHENGNSSQTPTLLYRVEPEPIQYTNTCPSHYGSGGDIRMNTTEYQQRENDYNNALAPYNTASTNYIAANDSTTRTYWADKMTYYNMQMARAAYDIIRSDMADTVAHPDKFKAWMTKLNTYASAEAMVDYYLQQGDYTTALNKVDSLPNRFAFTAYDSIEYPMYKDFKHKQATWLSDGRTMFDLTQAEVNSLIAIADSSKGTAGAQARGILLFAYDSIYSYVICKGLPGSLKKSSEINNGSGNKNSELTVSVKPNPAGNSVTFNYALPDNCSTGVVELYNNSGKSVKRVILTNNGTKTIDCSGLPSGIYLYRFIAGNTVSSDKLVIKH